MSKRGQTTVFVYATAPRGEIYGSESLIAEANQIRSDLVRIKCADPLIRIEGEGKVGTDHSRGGGYAKTVVCPRF